MTSEFAKVNPNVERVAYLPNEDIVNAQIRYLDEALTKLHPSIAAAFLASSVAAIAYIILETNDAKAVKQIFGALVDEAYSQRQRTFLANHDAGTVQ